MTRSVPKLPMIHELLHPYVMKVDGIREEILNCYTNIFDKDREKSFIRHSSVELSTGIAWLMAVFTNDIYCVKNSLLPLEACLPK